jgi:uncharacterized protein YndB with AHSA1/START domain
VNRTTIAIAPVLKTILVNATPQQAFEVFTAGLDRWWPKSHGIGKAPVTASFIEPFVGGRWYSTHEDGSNVTIGHVIVWQPPKRLIVSWEVSPDWKPDPRPAFTSEVEVRFTPAGEERTRVEVEHRDFERLGEQGGEKMRRDVDGGWPGLLELYAAEAAKAGRR